MIEITETGRKYLKEVCKVSDKEISIIENAVCNITVQFMDCHIPIGHDAVRQELGDEDFYASIDRAVFHWDTSADSKNGDHFEFDTSKWHKDDTNTYEGEDIELFTLPKELGDFSERDQRRIVSDFIMNTELKEFYDDNDFDWDDLFNYFEDNDSYMLDKDQVVGETISFVCDTCDEILTDEDECYRTIQEYGLKEAIKLTLENGYTVDQLDEHTIASNVLFEIYTKNINYDFIRETITKLIEGNNINTFLN